MTIKTRLLGTDAEGYRVASVNTGIFDRVSPCCDATPTFSGDGDLMCRACCRDLDMSVLYPVAQPIVWDEVTS